MFLDIDYSSKNQTLLSSSTDRHVRLWDPRVTGTFYIDIHVNVIQKKIDLIKITNSFIAASESLEVLLLPNSESKNC